MPRQSRPGKALKNTMKNIENILTTSQEQTSAPIHYTDLSRGAAIFGIRARVQLESRVLEDYQELDPALGHNVVGAILSVLGCREMVGGTLGDSRLSVCLARRESGQTVEVDLGVFRRCHGGQETYFFRFIDERELVLENY